MSDNTDHKNLHKEMDLIQAIIKRMAANSFEVKKWLIGILAAIMLFKYEKLMDGYIWLLLVPVLCFWYLDAYFLSCEHKYRKMYQWVIKYRLKTNKYLYDLNTMKRTHDDNKVSNFENKETGLFSAFFSKTLMTFYMVPIIFIVFYAFIYR